MLRKKHTVKDLGVKEPVTCSQSIRREETDKTEADAYNG